MAFIRFITSDYKIVGEKEVKEVADERFEEEIREYLKEYPKAEIALYWTDKDLERGYNHPYQIPTKEYLEYLKKIGRY